MDSKDRAEARDQAHIKRVAAYFRCFNTTSGRLVLADMKSVMPGKISGKTPEETIRNAAVRDLLDYIDQQISAGRDPELIPLKVQN